MSPLEVPAFRALLAVFACVLALVAWKIIDDWSDMRDEARRERHIRKHRWWRD